MALSLGGTLPSTAFIMWFFIIFVFLLGGGALFWFIRRNKQYSIRCTLHKVLQNGTIVEDRDWARLIRRRRLNQLTNELQFKRLKDTIENPPPEYYVTNKSGQQCLYFSWDGGHAYQPQKVQYDGDKVIQFEQGFYDAESQAALQLRLADERHANQGWWAQNWAQVASFIVVALMFVAVIVAFQKFSDFGVHIDGNSDAMNNLANALNGRNIIRSNTTEALQQTEVTQLPFGLPNGATS